MQSDGPQVGVGQLPRLGPCRNLHYVFKIGNRKASHAFITALGMHALRHEEFTEGCAASCNGPYDGRWSKTMAGYADEDSSFVLELTYNYNIKSYKLGNDFNSLTVHKKDAFKAFQGQGKAVQDGRAVEVLSPDGHKLVVVDNDLPGPNLIAEVALNVEDLDKALAYWHGFLGFAFKSRAQGEAVLSCGAGEAALRLVQLTPGTKIYHGTGFGRIAFSCPGGQLEKLESDVIAAGYKVHTAYVSLDTPGKASVQVVILQDPDGHEICFVGDEGFRELSKPDPEAPRFLLEAIEGDKSEEWEAKRLRREETRAVAAASGV